MFPVPEKEIVTSNFSPGQLAGTVISVHSEAGAISAEFPFIVTVPEPSPRYEIPMLSGFPEK